MQQIKFQKRNIQRRYSPGERQIVLNSNYIVLVDDKVPTFLHKMSNLSMLTNQESQAFIEYKEMNIRLFKILS